MNRTAFAPPKAKSLHTTSFIKTPNGAETGLTRFDPLSFLRFILDAHTKTDIERIDGHRVAH